MDNTARTYIDNLEQDLLAAKSFLHTGLEVALERIGKAAEKANEAMTDQSIAKLRALEDLSTESIDAIEMHLGELNFLAAGGYIKESSDFDKLAQPLSEALHDARQRLAKLDEIGVRELGSVAGIIGEAWRNLHLALDCARLELALAEKESKEDAVRLRQELTEKFDEALKVTREHDAKILVEKLDDITHFVLSHVGDSIKIFFGLSVENLPSKDHTISKQSPIYEATDKRNLTGEPVVRHSSTSSL